jgi:hypothetical protein
MADAVTWLACIWEEPHSELSDFIFFTHITFSCLKSVVWQIFLAVVAFKDSCKEKKM